MLVLLLIIIVAGCLGGWVRYRLTAKAGDGSPLGLWGHLGLGVLAAGVVPLFLELAASQIIENAAKEPRYYLVFAGFCLLFAYSAERTLERLTNQVLQRLEEKTEKLKEGQAQLNEKTTALEEKTDIAQEKAEAAQAEATAAAVVVAMPPAPESAPTSVGDTPNAEAALRALAAEYDEIRTKERGRPSSDRTRRMTALLMRMTRIVRESPTEIDPTPYLRAPAANYGMRLVGFAICYEKPTTEWVAALLRAIELEDKPFSVYWGLRALDRIASRLDGELLEQVADFVQSMMARPNLKGTDRYHVLRSIANQLDPS